MSDIEFCLVKLNSEELVTYPFVILYKNRKEKLSYNTFIDYERCKCITTAARFSAKNKSICFYFEGKIKNYYSNTEFQLSHACVVIINKNSKELIVYNPDSMYSVDRLHDITHPLLVKHFLIELHTKRLKLKKYSIVLTTNKQTNWDYVEKTV